MFFGCSPCCGPKAYCDIDRGLVSGLRVVGKTIYQSGEREYTHAPSGNLQEWSHQAVDLSVGFDAFFPSTFDYTEQVFTGDSVTFSDPGRADYTYQWVTAITAPTEPTILERPSIRFLGRWEISAGSTAGYFQPDWASIRFAWDPCYTSSGRGEFTTQSRLYFRRTHSNFGGTTNLLLWAFGKQIASSEYQYDLLPADFDCTTPGFALGVPGFSYIRSAAYQHPQSGYSQFSQSGYSVSFEVQLDVLEFVMADGTTIPYFECGFTDW